MVTENKDCCRGSDKFLAANESITCVVFHAEFGSYAKRVDK